MKEIYEYKKATIEDINELVRTRIIVLRAANKLSDVSGLIAACMVLGFRKLPFSGLGLSLKGWGLPIV